MECNREFVSLGLRPNDEQTEIVEVEDGEIFTKGLSWLDKYKIRNTYTPHTNNERSVDELILFEFAREWVIENHIIRKRPRAKERILQIFPRYDSSPAGPSYEDYCRVKLMLHHPFLEPNDLQMTNEDGDCSYALAYRVCQNEHNHPKDPCDRWKECKEDREEDQQSESEFDSERDIDELNLQAEWTELAARNRRADRLRNGITTNLGTRLLDLAYN